jgi:hypothetical protein
VEAGQLGFVGVYVLFVQSVRTLEIAWPMPLKRIPPYAIGSVASFWFLQRCMLMFT